MKLPWHHLHGCPVVDVRRPLGVVADVGVVTDEEHCKPPVLIGRGRDAHGVAALQHVPTVPGTRVWRRLSVGVDGVVGGCVRLPI